MNPVTLVFVPMYIESVKNRASTPTVLLRESWHQDGKVRKRTILNLSKWPEHLVDGLRSQFHGHVAAALGAFRQLRLDTLLNPQPSRYRDLACALIVARILQPRSQLATSRGLDPETLSPALGAVSDDDLYRAMDWLRDRQSAIEADLAPILST